MVRCINILSLLGLAIVLGCGKSAPVANQAAPEQGQPQESLGASTEPSPTDIVSSFLDQVRRGGEDSGAGELLTSEARVVLKQIGRTIQPLGSPDARYQVTRAEAVPNEKDSMLVHSIWSEPDGQGGASDYQVVWAVERESAGWRISGLVMELSPDQEPVMIDFENPELMKKMLGVAEQETASNPTNTRAAAPNGKISR